MNKIILSLICLYSLLSCNDFITEKPETHVNNQNFWKTEQDVATAVYGVQQNFRSIFGSITIIYRDRGLPFDWVGSLWQKISLNDLRSSWKLTSGNLLWADFYRIISNCNLVIDNIHRANLSEERRNFWETQVQFLKCFTYFYLIRTWGDIPYITNSEDITPHSRLSWLQVADNLRETLKKVVETAPSVNKLIDENGTLITSKQFSGKETAKVLWAQIDCWTAFLGNRQELYEEGIRLITEVIESGCYELLDNPLQVRDIGLLGDSKEGVFELAYKDSPEDIHTIGNTMCMMTQKWPLMPNTNPSTKRTIVRLSYKGFDELYNDPNDERRNVYCYQPDETRNYPQSINQGAVYFQKWAHFVTYQDGINAGKVRGYTGNLIIIRLSKLYLQRAAMRFRTGDISGAKDDLNIIRKRAKVKEYTETEGDLLKAIVLEQIREHLGEGINDRYFTIVENGFHKEMLLGGFKTLTDDDVKKGALFLPVALGAFTNNPFMRQTEYWKTIYGQ